HEHGQGDRTECCHLRRFGGRDPQQIAEDDVVEIDVRGRDRDEDEAEGEQGGEDDADRGIFLDPTGVAHRADESDGEEAEDHRPEGEGRAEDIGDHDSRQDGVGDRIAHERPADEHEPARKQGTHDRGDERGRQGPQHEVEGEGFEQEIDEAHAAPPPDAAPASPDVGLAPVVVSWTSRPKARARLSRRSTSAGESWSSTCRISRTASSASSGSACRSWVDTSTVTPAAASSLSSRTIVASLRLSTPAKGSSSSRIRAPWAM